jgi:hypothetical protein
MSMTTRNLWFACATGLVLAAACGSSHPMEGPALELDKRLVDLSEQERRTWCRWRNDWFVENYQIDSFPATLCGGGDQGGVVGTIENCVAVYGRVEAGCSQTVGRETRCYLEARDGQCPAHVPVHEGSPCRWPEDCGYDYDE